MLESYEVWNCEGRGATRAQVEFVDKAFEHIIHDEGADRECRNDIDSLVVEEDAVEFPAGGVFVLKEVDG